MRLSLIILAHDVVVALASLMLAILLTHEVELLPDDLALIGCATAILAAVASVCYLLAGLYRHVWRYTSASELGAVVGAATTVSGLFYVVTTAVVPAAAPPVNVLITQWALLVALLSGSRLVYRFVLTRRRWPAPAIRAETPMLVYGFGPIVSLFIQTVQAMPELNVRVVGIIDDSSRRWGRWLHQVPVLGPLEDLDRILTELAVRGVHPRRLAAAGEEHLTKARAIAGTCRSRHGLELLCLPDALSLSAASAAVAADDAPAPERLYFRVRRAGEAVMSALALLALAPLIAATALAVAVTIGRPVLSRRACSGRFLRPFTLYKFRTTDNARAEGTPQVCRQPASALGRFLQRSRLDELPQLYNVMRGDTSFVGPQPMPPQKCADEGASLAAVRPGITGWAQINSGHTMPPVQREALDRWYVDHACLALDGLILWRTLRAIGRGEEINHYEIEAAVSLDRSRRRLVIVNRYFYPDESATSQLATDLVAAIDPQCFATTVLTGRQHYVNSGGRLPAGEIFRGAKVRRIGPRGFGRTSLRARVFNALAFAASAFGVLVTTARGGDVILAKTDPPLLSVVAWLAAKLKGARLVNWCQDLYPETAAAMGIGFAAGPAGSALRALRNLSLNGAEVNVVPCDAVARRLAAEGVPQTRIAVIHNWADGQAIKPLPPHDNPLRRAWGLGGKFVLGYSGNLGLQHDVESLVELMTALKDEPDLLFLFIGAGSGYAWLRAAAAERRIENTVFRPYQARALLPQSLTAPDLHLVTMLPVFEGLIMPSKVYGALAAGRPVVFIGDPCGSVARVIAGGAGLVAARGAIAPLAVEICRLRAAPARLASMSSRARRAYDSLYNKDASLGSLIECLDRVAQPTPSPASQAVAAE